MKTSAQKFSRWGGQHAQFLGVLGVVAGGFIFIGSKTNHWAEEAKKIRTVMAKEVETLRAQVEKEAATRQAQVETANARVAQARAEAIQTTSDRFLLYGYAEEFKRYQNKALGEKAPPETD